VVDDALFAPWSRRPTRRTPSSQHRGHEKLLDELTLIGLVSEDSGWPPIDLDKLKIDLEEMKTLNKNNDVLARTPASSTAWCRSPSSATTSPWRWSTLRRRRPRHLKIAIGRQ